MIRERHFSAWVLFAVLMVVGVLLASGCGGGGSSTPAASVSVRISSRPATISAGASYTFIASVTNTSNTAVTWSLSCSQGVSNCGSINSSTGLYTAPIVSAVTSVTVVATCVADSTKSDAFTFQVVPIAAAVTITTRPGSINAGLSYQFAASVIGMTDTRVTWTMTCSTGVSACGNLGSTGLYQAPASVTQQSPVTVTATSVADPTKSDSFTFALFPAISVSLSPGAVQVSKGFGYPFLATVDNDLQYVGVTWSVNGVAGGNAQTGTITAVTDPYTPSWMHGMYMAPANIATATVTVTATSKVDGSKSASTTVTLIANPHPNFTGNFAFLISGPGGGDMAGIGGVLSLDGAGHFSATMDVHQTWYDDTVLAGIAATGTYGFDGVDGGWATLNYSNGTQSASSSFRFVLTSDTTAKVIEFDGMGGATGTIEKQGTNLNSALDGDHVLMLKGEQVDSSNSSQLYTVLGQFTGAAGTLAGTWDMADYGGSYNNQSLIGWYSIGTTSTLNLGFQGWTAIPGPDFFLYPVSTDRSLIMSKVRPLLVGSIDRQSGGPFGNSSLSGNWVFYYVNDVPSLSKATLGTFTADGSGNSAPGCTDTTGSGFVPPACYSLFDLGNYTVSATGRGYSGQAQWGSPHPTYLYFIDANHGYLGTQSGTGEFFRLTGNPFTNASLSGNYTVLIEGIQDWFWNAKSDNETGVAAVDGNGNLSAITSWYDARHFSLQQGYARTGTYAFDNGLYTPGMRGYITLGSDMNLVFYAVSPDKLFFIQFDDNDVAFGMMQRSAYVAPGRKRAR